MNYTTPRDTRRESRTLVGRFRGGKLAPVLAVPVRGNEGGMLSQSITMELDPIAGRMITPITGEVIAVFVPVQAIDAIKDPAAAYAGMTEVIREKLLSGNPLFGLENETEISKRLGVNPRSFAGVKKVNEMARLAHNAAVNHLRVRKYVNAAKILHTSTAITPAIISQTVLDRLNGVLDPEDRVNGMVNFETGTVTSSAAFPETLVQNINAYELGAANRRAGVMGTANEVGGTSTADVFFALGNTVQPNTAALSPKVPAQSLPVSLSGLNLGSVSLTDFYNAQRMDELVRTLRTFVDENPDYGEEIAMRYVHGMLMEVGKHPIVIHESSQIFGRAIVGATDSAGVAADTMRSDMMLQMSFSVPIPRSELGGIIITFAVLKPDETLSSQPHPFLSDVWGADNFVADEMALDPVPVTIRELDSDCLQAQEATVALYVGHNGLKRTYVHYGLNRHLNPTTVANKTAIWQLEVPMSVTPQSVIYPDTLVHYPFADQNAEVCTYTISSNLTVKTPIIFGPTPVEELAILETENVFPA